MRLVERCPSLLALLSIGACWPVWLWMAQRAVDRSDEPWPCLALLTAAVIVWRRRAVHPASGRLVLATLLIALYAGTVALLPPLLRAVLGVSAVAATLSAIHFRRVLYLPLWGLLLLSLPIISSLNFYLGYPLRVVTGAASAMLLRVSGLPVVRDGTLLAWNGVAVSVDAPCSGIRMLWTGCYLCLSIAALRDFDAARTAALCLVGFLVVMVANILRASALFHVETGMIGVPAAWHDAVGAATFAFCAAALVLAARGLEGRRRAS